MLAYTFGLLFLYWLIKTMACRPAAFVKLGQITLAMLSLLLFLILPKEFVWQPLLLIGAALAFSLLRHIKKKSAPLRLSSLLGWGSFYGLGVVVALLSTAFQYHSEEVVGHVILKGRDQSTWVTWKNPSQPVIEGAWLPSYEVEVQDAKGRLLYSDFMMGDFVGVRAQVITIHWPYHFLGFSHLYRLELVHNGYATAQRHQFFPHTAYALPFPAKLFENLWNRLFTRSWKFPGVKSSTLESSYFPLRDAGLKPSIHQYDLVVGSTGLSARLVNTCCP